MNDTDERNPGAELAKRRWGTRGVDRAIEVVSARSAELTPAHRARLRELADAPKEEDR